MPVLFCLFCFGALFGEMCLSYFVPILSYFVSPILSFVTILSVRERSRIAFPGTRYATLGLLPKPIGFQVLAAHRLSQ